MDTVEDLVEVFKVAFRSSRMGTAEHGHEVKVVCDWCRVRTFSGFWTFALGPCACLVVESNFVRVDLHVLARCSCCGAVIVASLVSTSAPLFVTYSRVNQWQICCAFVETVHLWRPKRCVVDLLMLGHKSWCFRLFVGGLSTFRCH